MKIFIGADHAGYELKTKLIPFLQSLGHEIVDNGAYGYAEYDDYPDFIEQVANMVSHSPDSSKARGIILGGSGQGEAILANKYPHVRAVVFNGQYVPSDGRQVPDEIFLSRDHNDSNILSLGARFLSEEEAKDAVREWLETPFSAEERHVRRLEKVEKLTSKVHQLWTLR